MITGDNQLTAVAIAKECSILNSADPIVLLKKIYFTKYVMELSQDGFNFSLQ